jgi:hypothetical protein
LKREQYYNEGKITGKEVITEYRSGKSKVIEWRDGKQI